MNTATMMVVLLGDGARGGGGPANGLTNEDASADLVAEDGTTYLTQE